MSDADNGFQLTVGRVELIEALARRTKMLRAPAGVRSTNLKEAAFIPALGGVRVEMPGGSHFVWALEGSLPDEIIFDPKFVNLMLSVLKSQEGRSSTATLSISASQFEIRCGSAKLRVPKGSGHRRRRTRPD